MRKIKLMADYFRFPLWDASGNDTGPVSPDSLPISNSLRDALMAWSQSFDATIDMNDPARAGFNSQKEIDEFKAKGRELGIRLQNELGSEYEIGVDIAAFRKPQ